MHILQTGLHDRWQHNVIVIIVTESLSTSGDFIHHNELNDTIYIHDTHEHRQVKAYAGN